MQVAFGYCCLSAVSDRLFVLRACNTPPAFNTRLLTSVLRLVPYSALLHFAFGTWFFSSVGDGASGACAPLTHSLRPA